MQNLKDKYAYTPPCANEICVVMPICFTHDNADALLFTVALNRRTRFVFAYNIDNLTAAANVKIVDYVQ